MSWSSPSCEPRCRGCAALRAAAVAIVGRDGLEALGWERLCATAQVAQTQVRSHYASCADCLLAAYDEAAEAVFVAYTAPFRAAPSWSEGLMAATDALLARLAERPDEARLLFVEILRGDGAMRRHRDRERRRSVELLACEHHRRRLPEELPDVQFELLHGAMFQMIAAEVAAGRSARLHELRDELLTLASIFEPIAA
jgi:AcrR family transcriptional regulator